MPDPASQATALDGHLLGDRYRLGPVIATGGMAQVRRADDVVLGRKVAVKILHPHLAADPTVVERFRNEAVAAARLTHPGIVSIYDTVIDDGTGDDTDGRSDVDVNAIVMELVDGITLRQFLDQRGHLAPRDAVDIVAGVADALQTAHEAGVVHRDIKPANILLCDDRRVMVTDFGIAKAALGDDLTRDGSIVGTAKYVAPEQVNGDRIDPRTDVYSLGVVLYECLCGRPPFEADTEASTALARLHRDPLRPRQVRPSVPRSLDALTMQMLARDPDDRPTTAAVVRAEILGAALDEPVEEDSEPVVVSGTIATTEHEADEFVRSERRWLVPTMLVLIVGGALLLAALLIGSTEAGKEILDRARDVVQGDPSAESTEDPGPIDVVETSTFDPQGFGEPGERDEEVALASDGDPSTAWRTEFYSDRNLGTKDGVGLVIDLGDSRELESLTVTSATDDWAATIYVAGEVPTNLAGWGDPVTSLDAIEPGDSTFDLGDASGRYVLVWITDLGPGPESALDAEIAEVAVAGR